MYALNIGFYEVFKTGPSKKQSFDRACYVYYCSICPWPYVAAFWDDHTILVCTNYCA